MGTRVQGNVHLRQATVCRVSVQYTGQHMGTGYKILCNGYRLRAIGNWVLETVLGTGCEMQGLVCSLCIGLLHRIQGSRYILLRMRFLPFLYKIKY